MAEEQTHQFHRAPAVYRPISGITPEDIRVRIIGKVLELTDNKLVIDDGTGKAEIILERPAGINTENVKDGDDIRVFCRVIPLDDGFELHGEIIQSTEGVDKRLYSEIFGISEKNDY